MRSRLPQALGGDGTAETVKELEGITLDGYRKQIAAARRLGSLTGQAFGSSGASDPGTQGFLRSSEAVIDAMTEQERASEALTGERMRELADQLDLTVDQVDSVLARYLYTKHMMHTLAAHRKDGKAMPETMDDLERLCGDWRAWRRRAGGGASVGQSGIFVPVDQKDVKGNVCELAGMTVGRSKKCPRYRRAWKACCGKRGHY
jgi:hypothetical protein